MRRAGSKGWQGAGKELARGRQGINGEETGADWGWIADTCGNFLRMGRFEVDFR